MAIKIKLNQNKTLVKEIKDALKNNNNFCPCRIEKSEDTKCMCKEFRDRVANGTPGECHCGLYIAELEEM